MAGARKAANRRNGKWHRGSPGRHATGIFTYTRRRDAPRHRGRLAAVGVQTDGGLGDDGRRVQLVRDRDPVMAPKAALREPATDLAPRRRLMRALALDAPAEARPAMTGGIVIDADNA